LIVLADLETNLNGSVGENLKKKKIDSCDGWKNRELEDQISRKGQCYIQLQVIRSHLIFHIRSCLVLCNGRLVTGARDL